MSVIINELKKLGTPAKREVLMRFFKTGKGEYGEGDEFLGVKVPEVRSVVKAHWRNCSDCEIRELTSSCYHEARLAGLLILIERYKGAKGDEERKESVVKEYLNCLGGINNWDLVDLTCPAILGDWYFCRDRELLREMAEHGSTIWEQRIAIVSTLTFIRRGDNGTTLELADILLHHPHDLIQKAVGWMLREVGKRDQQVLQDFLDIRSTHMPRTMLRYAIERLPEPLRQAYLRGESGVLALPRGEWGDGESGIGVRCSNWKCGRECRGE